MVLLSMPSEILTKMFITEMLSVVLLIAAIVGVSVVFLADIGPIFMANPYLNGLILGLTVMGVAHTIKQMYVIYGDTRWLAQPNTSWKPRFTVDADSIDLESIQNLFFETRKWNRYVMNLLIMLGLLGTFWGLSITIIGIAKIIGSISTSHELFEQMKTDLQVPITGMSTAFSSSIFGLVGSLIIGFLDMQVQKMFHKLFVMFEKQVAQKKPQYGGPSYSEGLLELMAENLLKLEQALSKNVKNQDHLYELLTEKSFDIKASENILRNIQKEIVASREWCTEELRGEIRVISKILSKATGQ